MFGMDVLQLNANLSNFLESKHRAAVNRASWVLCTICHGREHCEVKLYVTVIIIYTR